MVFQPSKALLHRWLPRARVIAQGESGDRGFTLIELLVAMVVGSIITGTLLFLVVELLQINRREDLLTQTQQDMRRAIDYITRDASEAIHVYANPTAITGQITDPPANSVPVLAFWRLDPLSQAELNALANVTCSGADLARCSTLKIRQSTYTLVVYYHTDNSQNTAGNIWGGPARIIRYELPQYTNLVANGFAQTTGYNDPSLSENFATWTRTGASTRGIKAVLTDYVDMGKTVVAATACPTPPPNAVYVVNTNAPSSFYTCTLEGDVTTPDLSLTTRINQSMRVYLSGNASTGQFGIATFNEGGRLPALDSEIIVRGVIQRQPGS